jgi:hypothetical protein
VDLWHAPDDDAPTPEENPMSLVQRFADYAAAFEKTVETNETSHIEPFFTEDAVYETIGGPPFEGVEEGRDAVFASLIGSLDGFDRRFDSRELELLEGPEERDGSVWIRWRARYTKAGLPDLAIDGEETATFEGDRIRRLEDRFTPEATKGAVEYLAEHGKALGIEG